MTSNLIRERAGKAPYIRPVLDALDRLQHRGGLPPQEHTRRARALLDARMGTSSARTEAAFAHGGTGLLGEHTHYFDGFAILLSLPLGTAVAIRRSPGRVSHIAFEGSERVWSWGGDDGHPVAGEEPTWVRLVAQLVRRFTPAGDGVDVAVVSTVNASCMDAYLSALAVATARALQASFAVPESNEALMRALRETVAAASGLPFSIAYLIVADAGMPDAFSLVDTATLERLPLDVPSHEVLGWGLVDVGTAAPRGVDFFVQRKDQSDEAVAVLQRKAFPALASLRELDHRDLQAALAALPRRLRPTVRHLVTENRRVQKMVVAIRNADWQMLGAILLMSHASQRNEWRSTNPEMDLVVDQVERMSIEGMHGACMTGRGACVLIVGQPFELPACIDRIDKTMQDAFSRVPETVLL